METPWEPKLKHSTYDPKTQQVIEDSADDSPHSVIEAATAHAHRHESRLTYEAAIGQLAGHVSAEEELLVTKISIAVTMMPPSLPEERLHHALFTKQMYLAGEITFTDYILKMRNLFPDRMEALSAELRASVARQMGESN